MRSARHVVGPSEPRRPDAEPGLRRARAQTLAGAQREALDGPRLRAGGIGDVPSPPNEWPSVCVANLRITPARVVLGVAAQRGDERPARADLQRAFAGRGVSVALRSPGATP